MSFKFDFFKSEPVALLDDVKPASSTKPPTSSTRPPASSTRPPVTVTPYNPTALSLLFEAWNTLTLTPTASYHYLKCNLDVPGVEADSDLVPEVYEGGFQVWECTVDLMKFVEAASEERMGVPGVVLDLGCGAGLLGIQAKLKYPGAAVHFQDFNDDVIKNFTLKNYHKNCEHLESSDNVKFISGDWADIGSELGKYSIILSAETIYSKDSQTKVLHILTTHLSETGVAFIASKRHYFGVGGGVVDFEELLLKSGCLRCRVVWSSEEGLIRDILMVSRVPS